MKKPNKDFKRDTPVVIPAKIIKDTCSILLLEHLKPRHLEPQVIINCVVTAVSIYFDEPISEILNFNKRGNYTELRSIVFFILRRRGDDYFTLKAIAEHFKTHDSKVCLMVKRIRERINHKLYDYDKAIAIIEQTLNELFRNFEKGELQKQHQILNNLQDA